jgi:TIR domain
MRAIFVCYRREDVEGHALRLFQDLSTEFGKPEVFMDVAGIHAGLDFRRIIEQQLASCGVLLAVIGTRWSTVVNGAGRRRLDDPADLVRQEIASALRRDIPVIPVLVQGAQMPTLEVLPEELKDLVYRNFVELTHARWDSDVRLLIEAIIRIRSARPEDSPDKPDAPPDKPDENNRIRRIVVGAGIVVLAAVLAAANLPEIRGSRPVVEQNLSAPPSPASSSASGATPGDNSFLPPIKVGKGEPPAPAAPVDTRASTVGPLKGDCTITTSFANVYAEPKVLLAPRIGQVSGRRTLKVLKQVNYQHGPWPIPMYQVSVDGQLGWISNLEVESIGPQCAR